jgi:ATP-binding cassette subfamily B multidrug efflux pump
VQRVAQQRSTSAETRSSETTTPLSSLLPLLVPQFKRHRVRLAVGFAALLVVDLLQLSIPQLLKRGIDGLSAGSATPSMLALLGLAIVAIAVLVVLLRFVWRTLIIGFSRYLERALRNRVFSHILTMDQHFFSSRSTGSIMAHVTNDLTAVQMACGMGMVAAADALVMSVAAIGFMLYISPSLTFFALLPMPILAIATRVLSARLHHRFNTVQEQFGVLTEFARSALVAVKLSKAYTLESLQTGEFDKMGRTYVDANIKVARIQGVLFPAATLIGNMGLLAIVVFGGRLAIDETISMGDFVAFITYLQMLIWPMMAVGWVANLFQRGATSLRRIYLLLDAEPLLPDHQDNTVHHISAPSFRLNGLSFTYPGASTPQLEDISIDVSQGLIVGIAGRTGSGKSTFCKILVRLHDVADGAYHFGGIDVNQLPLDEVRNRIAYVSQEPVLFSDTIGANISFGRADASSSEIEQAARDAVLHDDIMGFDNGYQTIIGERGVTLSGGQRQRLALARALLSDRPVLVIDDGLSAVDTQTEHRILATLRERFQEKTVFIVSNRIKLLSMTDIILIFDRGRLVNSGSHEELLAANDFYRAMHEKQMNSEPRD